MKKLPWSSITSGLVRNFFIFGVTCPTVAARAIVSSRVAPIKSPVILGNLRSLYLTKPSSSSCESSMGKCSVRQYGDYSRNTLDEGLRHAGHAGRLQL